MAVNFTPINDASYKVIGTLQIAAEARIKSYRVLHIAYIVTRLPHLSVNQLILKPGNR